MANIYRLKHKETGRWFHWGFFKSGYQADKPTYAKTFDTLAGAEEHAKKYPDFEPVSFPAYTIVSSDRPYRKILVEGKDFETAIKRFCWEELRIHDSDNCGDETISVAIVSPDNNETRYYNIEHSWWWQDGEEGHYMENSFEYEQKPKAELKEFVAEPKRDWIKV